MKRCELCSAASSRVCSFWDQSYAHFILLMLNSEMDCLCTEECLISFGLNGAVQGVSCLSPHGSWDGFSSPEKEGNEVDDGWIIKQSVFHFDTFLLTRMRGCWARPDGDVLLLTHVQHAASQHAPGFKIALVGGCPHGDGRVRTRAEQGECRIRMFGVWGCRQHLLCAWPLRIQISCCWAPVWDTVGCEEKH